MDCPDLGNCLENNFLKSLPTVRRQSPNALLAWIMRLWTAAPPFTKGRRDFPLWERGIEGDFHGSRVANPS